MGNQPLPLESRVSDWTTKPKRKLRLLLVEDSPDGYNVVLKVFQQPPSVWEVQLLENGQQAVDFLFKLGSFDNAWRPDLVLLNLNLPRLTGHEVLAEVKKDSSLRRIPIVLWTVSKRAEDIEKAYGAGIAAYLCKQGPTKSEFPKELIALRSFWERVCFLGDVV
jgi:CheY-like chemotaxis protein